MTKTSLVKGTAVLAAAGLFVKFLGAFFRIPLANMIGAVGMANYAPAYSLYNVLLVFSTAGVPVAVSKMVSERHAAGRYAEADRVFQLSRLLMLVTGMLGFGIVFLYAEEISELFHVPGASLSMRAMAPALLLVPLVASYRGYFQGMNNMVPTAVSQITEQIFRVAAGLALAMFLKDNAWIFNGFTWQQRGAAGGCFGAAAGGLGGLLAIGMLYLTARRQLKERIRRDRTPRCSSSFLILKRILAIALPITLGAAIMPIVGLIDAGVVAARLQSSGWEKEVAEDLYGQLTGFAAPLIGFPQILIQSVVVSLVPLAAAAKQKKDVYQLQETLGMGYRIAMILGTPCAAGLIALAQPILLLLYPTQKASAIHAAPCLQLLGLGFFALAVVQVSTGALQGIGRQMVPVRNLLIGVAVKFVLTWSLTAVPAVNIKGAALGNAAAYLIAAALDVRALRQATGLRLQVVQTFFKPVICSAIMGVTAVVSYTLFVRWTGHNSIACLGAVAVAILVYGLMILRTGTIRRAEMSHLPQGETLISICDRLKLW